MLTNSQMQKIKQRLQKSKEQLEEHMSMNDHFGLERGHYHESMGELSSYDNHPGDEGTDLYEREKDIALNDHGEYLLKEVVNALTRMENGVYGKCVTCGKEIAYERLEALPYTSYCIDHSPDRTISTNRPIEEGVLMPPFGKFDKDEKNESVVYDAEDSWQEVASWGTSETPSDLALPVDHYNDMYLESEEYTGYVEEYENFAATDIHGNPVSIYPSKQHERYEEELDEEGLMSPFGDLPAYEHDPYSEKEKE
ncbi:TraR/DksA C4-type zinc finger protein [Bacillus massilinigeriensis]|uniref:TraR/DksA C4-type zinc finger protein n=1 Tax=Bacillus mediterraneensis TaxID=1805474 RepID=UPI0008F89E8E|nr:TraR/DksA C4-type zinc finger protein [Bacillus mediterraneensis]